MEVIAAPDEKEWVSRFVSDFSSYVKGIAAPEIHVSLAGGNSPMALYERLCHADLPWERMIWWIGDERCVPLSSEDRNEKMIRDTLGALGDLGWEEMHLKSWGNTNEPGVAAQNYDKKIREQLRGQRLHLALVGLGSDGHVASLFPETDVLQERKQLAKEVFVPGLDVWRLSLTYPMFDAAEEVWFVVRGPNKESAVQRLKDGDLRIPAARIQCPRQRLYWLPHERA